MMIFSGGKFNELFVANSLSSYKNRVLSWSIIINSFIYTVIDTKTEKCFVGLTFLTYLLIKRHQSDYFYGFSLFMRPYFIIISVQRRAIKIYFFHITPCIIIKLWYRPFSAKHAHDYNWSVTWKSLRLRSLSCNSIINSLGLLEQFVICKEGFKWVSKWATKRNTV